MRRTWLLLVALVLVVGLGVSLRRWPSGEQGRERPSTSTDPAHSDSVSSRDQSDVRPLPSAARPTDGSIDTSVDGSVSKPLQSRERALAGLRKLKLSPAVRTLTGVAGDRQDAKGRVAALRKLTRQLSKDDIQGILLFLDFHIDQEAIGIKLRPMVFNALKNDALDVLLRQNERVDGVGSVLVHMYRDKTHDTMWRDYCVQYFYEYYRQKWPDETTVARDPEHAALVKAYWEAAAETDTDVAGAALLGLERFSRSRATYDRQRVAELVLSAALNESTCETSRITALRLCGEMKLAAVVTCAREVAQTGSTPPLRTAAIATLGDVGTRQDLDVVESLALSSNKRIGRIATAALAKLKARHQERSGS